MELGLVSVKFHDFQQVLEVRHANVIHQCRRYVPEVQPNVDRVDAGTSGHVDRVMFFPRGQRRQTSLGDAKTRWSAKQLRLSPLPAESR